MKNEGSYMAVLLIEDSSGLSSSSHSSTGSSVPLALAMETSEGPQCVVLLFQLQLDKSLASQVKTMEWNPKKNWPAMVKKDSKAMSIGRGCGQSLLVIASKREGQVSKTSYTHYCARELLQLGGFGDSEYLRSTLAEEFQQMEQRTISYAWRWRMRSFTAFPVL